MKFGFILLFVLVVLLFCYSMAKSASTYSRDNEKWDNNTDNKENDEEVK